MRYSYYPGCTLKTRAKELDRYARLSAVALGAELEELPEWQCCGAVYPQASDEIAARLASVRALMAAEGGYLMTMCSACYHVLKRTNCDWLADANFREKATFIPLDGTNAAFIGRDERCVRRRSAGAAGVEPDVDGG